MKSFLRYLHYRVYRQLHPLRIARQTWLNILQTESAAWQAAVKKAKGGPRILIPTTTGHYTAGVALESLLAVALTLRGAEVHLLLCDSALPACSLCLSTAYAPEDFAKYGPKIQLCDSCFKEGRMAYSALQLPLHRYSQFVQPHAARLMEQLARDLPIDQIENYQKDGLKLGEQARSGALRFFARGTLEGEAQAEAVLRRFFKGALFTAEALHNLLNTHSYEMAVFHHGIYVPMGVIGDVCRTQKVRVVNWNMAYRKKSFIFSHGQTYHHTLMDEPVSAWENLLWTSTLDQQLTEYLRSRWEGTQDWIWFHEQPESNLKAIAQETGIDFSKPTIGLLTNVFWDAQLHYPANAFANMLVWLTTTIEYFARRPDLQLVIRVHPAEIRGHPPSRQKIAAEIKRLYPQLPAHIFVIPPESAVSTYAAMFACDSVIIYGTKTGVELASFGMPVIVAGEAWIRNKGITLDARNQSEYLALLEQLPLRQRLSPEQTVRARKYAYHFFFRRMIPLQAAEPKATPPLWHINVEALAHLQPGVDRGLDVICDGILSGAPFIYPAEQI